MVAPARTHESKLSAPLIEKLECQTFIYDKALDSREIRNNLIKKGITPVIPYRKNVKKKKPINKETYNKRNLAESIISAIKRVYGGTVKNKKPNNQNKQVILKIINYNLNQTLKTLIKHITKINHFYTAVELQNF